MSLYREHGIVLRTYKLGEADRIVVFVTRGHGKVRAVAKGVRKTKSRFGSRLEPGSHVALQLYEGRELDIVTQAESVDHFRAIRDDLDRLAGAQVMLEATDQVSQEHEPDARLYQLLLGALRTLAGSGSPLVVPAFLLKLLAADGVQPLVEVCASCGEDTPLVAFDLGAGGLLCRSCRSGIAVSPDAVEPAAGRPRRPAQRRPGRARERGHPRGHPSGDVGHGAPPRAPPAHGRRPRPRLRAWRTST